MSERTSDAGQQPVAGVVPDATDPQHPEWWYTLWYAETEEASSDGLHCRIFAAQEEVWPSARDLLVGEVAYEVADLIVAWWNDNHAAPGTQTTDQDVDGFPAAGGTDGDAV